MCSLEDVFLPVGSSTEHASAEGRTHKVTIIGVGGVGMACAYSMLNKGIVGHLVLADVQQERLQGEVLDLQHAGLFLPCHIEAASQDYSETKNSDICIITAGARQNPGESRLSLVDRNVAIFKQIVPKIVALSPDVIIIVVSNPADILAYITWKLSGLPSNRVFGSGTFLDSSRFRTLIAKKLNVSPTSVHGWIIGEHGDSSVPVWSGLSVAGVSLSEAKDALDCEAIHKTVVRAAYEVIKLKGYTNWAIGAAVCSLVQCILRNERRVVPISTLVKDIHDVSEEVFMSVPCVLGHSGIIATLRQNLSENEETQFQNAAKSLWDVQRALVSVAVLNVKLTFGVNLYVKLCIAELKVDDGVQVAVDVYINNNVAVELDVDAYVSEGSPLTVNDAGIAVVATGYVFRAVKT
eukprot:gene8083-759_t